MAKFTKIVILKKTLVFFAHPYYEHSTTNVQLINCYKNNPQITLRDLYEDYPDFHIHAFRERKRIADYDRLVFHFPLIWFGLPPLLKLWIDEVFDMKWISQNHENPLAGKEAIIIVTAGGSNENYSENGRYKATIQQLLMGLRLSLEVNDIDVKEEFFIYNADNLQGEQLLPLAKELTLILEK